MQLTIYADVLFCVNFFIDFALLSVTARLLKKRIRGVRLTLCSALGAAYSVVLFFPGLGFLASLAAKLLFSAVLALTAFGAHSLWGYIKSLLIFYAVSFGFGGTVFGLYLLFKPQRLLIRNDVIYFDIDPLLLFLFIGGAYAAVWLISRMLPKKTEQHFELIAETDGISIKLSALYDSGNMLTDVLSGEPVIVAEFDAVKKLIPKEARRGFCLRCGAFSRDAAEWGHGYRLIAAHGAFGKDMLLPAFRPDSVTVSGADGTHPAPSLFIAVTDRTLSSDGRYCAVIGCDVLRRSSDAVRRTDKHTAAESATGIAPLTTAASSKREGVRT